MTKKIIKIRDLKALLRDTADIDIIKYVDVEELGKDIDSIKSLINIDDDRIEGLIKEINISDIINSREDLTKLLSTGLLSKIIVWIKRFFKIENKEFEKKKEERMEMLIKKINILDLVKSVDELRRVLEIKDKRIDILLENINTLGFISSIYTLSMLLEVNDPKINARINVIIKKIDVSKLIESVSNLKQLLEIKDSRIDKNEIIKKIDVSKLIRYVSDLKELLEIKYSRINKNEVIKKIDVSELIKYVSDLKELLKIKDEIINSLIEKIDISVLVKGYNLEELLEIEDPRINMLIKKMDASLLGSIRNINSLKRLLYLIEEGERSDVDEAIKKIDVSSLVRDLHSLIELLKINDKRINTLIERINIYYLTLISNIQDLKILLAIKDSKISLKILIENISNNLYSQESLTKMQGQVLDLNKVIQNVDTTILVRNSYELEELLKIEDPRINILIKKVDASLLVSINNINSLKRLLYSIEEGERRDIDQAINKIDVSRFIKSVYDLKALFRIQDERVNVLIKKIDIRRITNLERLLDDINDIDSLKRLLKIDDPRINTLIQKIDLLKLIKDIDSLISLLNIEDARINILIKNINISRLVLDSNHFEIIKDFLISLEIEDQGRHCSRSLL